MQFLLCSCLISRNLLAGLRTCEEVARYMYAEALMPHGSMGENAGFDAMSTVSITNIHVLLRCLMNIRWTFNISSYIMHDAIGLEMSTG
jgi:hypothetical protein